MIVGYNMPKDVKLLYDSEFFFFLTGERFFNGKSKNDKWHFFAEDTNEIIAFLEKNGFDVLYTCDYKQTSNYKKDNVYVYLVPSDKLGAATFINEFLKENAGKIASPTDIWMDEDFFNVLMLLYETLNN